MDIFLQVIANGVLLGGVFALISIGLTLIFGIVRIVNFAHGELLMVGLYAAWILSSQLGLNPYLAALPLVVIFYGIGVAMQRVIIQPLMSASQDIQIFATVGVSTALANGALLVFSADLRSVDLPWARQPVDLFGIISVSRGNLVAFAVSVIATAGLMAFLQRTHLGRAIRAVAQNRYAAPLMGIDVNRIYAITFGLGTACVGLAAAVLSPLYPAFPTVGSLFVLIAFVVVVLGGMGSLEGAVIGALIIGLVDSLAGYYIAPDMKEVAYFAIFLGILIVRPAGLGLLFLLPAAIIPALDAEGAAFWQHIFVTIFVFAAMSCAWNIIGGFAGQLSLGQTIFYGIGGYTAALLNQNFGIIPWLAGPLGALIAIIVAIAISWPCLRLRGPFFALSTIAFLEVIRLLAIHFKDFTGGSAGLPIPMFVGTEMRIGWAWMLFREKENYLVIAFGLLLLCLGASWLVRRSRLGFYLVAVREREDAAKAVGVNTTAVKLSAFALSAALTSLVGTFHGVYLNFIDPETMFSLPLAIQIAMFPLIGGLGTVTGPVWGTLLVVPIAEFARGWLGAAANGLHGLVYGVVLVLVVLTMPHGLVGSIGPWLRRRFATALPDAAGAVAPPPASAAGSVRAPIGEPILEARDLVRRFGGLVATSDVSVTLRQGEVIGVIGPNGAGKTTLFNLLSGFLPPSAGSIRVRGADGTWQQPSTPHQFAAAGVARTFQVVQPFAGLSVRENVMLGAFHHAHSAVEARRLAEEVLATVGLGNAMDMPARSLTIAGAKRLEVARALAMKPRVLLLDEVMAGLNPADVGASVELLKRVRDSGVSILAIEHVMAAVMALSDRIVVINSGKMIAEGTPSEIAHNPIVLEAYLGEDYVHVGS